MLAFPHLLIEPSGDFRFSDGLLFKLPPELCDQYRLEKYSSISKIGWSQSELGYWALARRDGRHNLIILPGLILLDAAQPSKKFHGYRATFSKAQVEQYLDSFIEWQNGVQDATDAELGALIHDLRHLSGAIYHNAVEAESSIKSGNLLTARDRIKSIIASQTMLKVRIDYLDYSNSVGRFIGNEKIPVYRRVDKVIRCFRADASHKKIEINLTGRSYQSASGPNIFDIAPYTVLENAIKYAPRETEIDVYVSDNDSSTTVEILSVGPSLLEGETERIFDRGYRGSHAKSVRPNGTGLGLSVADSVVRTFNGSIAVSQESAGIWNGIPHSKIKFTFTIPTSRDERRPRPAVENQRANMTRTSIHHR